MERCMQHWRRRLKLLRPCSAWTLGKSHIDATSGDRSKCGVLHPVVMKAWPSCRFIRSDHVGINRLQFLLDSLTDLDNRCNISVSPAVL